MSECVVTCFAAPSHEGSGAHGKVVQTLNSARVQVMHVGMVTAVAVAVVCVCVCVCLRGVTPPPPYFFYRLGVQRWS